MESPPGDGYCTELCHKGYSIKFNANKYIDDQVQYQAMSVKTQSRSNLILSRDEY